MLSRFDVAPAIAAFNERGNRVYDLLVCFSSSLSEMYHLLERMKTSARPATHSSTRVAWYGIQIREYKNIPYHMYGSDRESRFTYNSFGSVLVWLYNWFNFIGNEWLLRWNTGTLPSSDSGCSSKREEAGMWRGSSRSQGLGRVCWLWSVVRAYHELQYSDIEVESDIRKQVWRKCWSWS